jgi:protein phosphatase
MTFDLAGRTHVGLKRSENQDEVYAQVLGTGDRKVACLAVADGMGGHVKGREASQTAIGTLREKLQKEFQSDLGVPTEQLCVQLEEDAHESVSRIASGSEVAGTTLTVALLTDEECVIGHVGDSRLYCYRDGKLEQITEDQTWEAYSAKNHIENTFGNSLRQAVGVGSRVVPDTYRLPVLPDDWIVVCSDGLYKMVDISDVEDALAVSAGAADACERLVTLALDGGGRDNVGVCVARFGNPPKTSKPVNSVLIAAYTAVVVVAALLVLTLVGKI